MTATEPKTKRPPHEKALAALLFSLITGDDGSVGFWIDEIKRAGWRYVGICDESGITAMVKESIQQVDLAPTNENDSPPSADGVTFSPPEADACPTCKGSGRAWVHDAAGGFGTTCRECDGTGTR